MMSLPPLVLIIYLLGRFLLAELIPPSSDAVSATTSNGLGGSWLLTIIGILLLLAASKVFLELQMALNRIWGAPPSRHRFCSSGSSTSQPTRLLDRVTRPLESHGSVALLGSAIPYHPPGKRPIPYPFPTSVNKRFTSVRMDSNNGNGEI